MRFLGVCALIAAAVTCGCGGKVDIKDVPGAYKAILPWGESTLELRRNGQLRQTVEPREGEKQVVEGIWKQGQAHDILLTPFIQFDRGGKKKTLSMMSIVPEYDSQHHVYLEIDANDGTSFHR